MLLGFLEDNLEGTRILLGGTAIRSGMYCFLSTLDVYAHSMMTKFYQKNRALTNRTVWCIKTVL